MRLRQQENIRLFGREKMTVTTTLPRAFTSIASKPRISLYFAEWYYSARSDATEGDRSASIPVDESRGGQVPDHFELTQNYPNPFNPTTAVRYRLSAFSKVRLCIFDVVGREVAVLVDEEKPAGR